MPVRRYGKMPDFAPGDTVVIRDWDDMLQEYGLDDDDESINCRFRFTEEMREFCGLEMVIKEITPRGSVRFCEPTRDMTCYSFSTDMIRHVEDTGDLCADDFMSIIDEI